MSRFHCAQSEHGGHSSIRLAQTKKIKKCLSKRQLIIIRLAVSRLVVSLAQLQAAAMEKSGKGNLSS